MKNIRMFTVTSLLTIPMLFACNGDKNALTYSGGNEFVIDNDTLTLTLNLKNELKADETVSEPTFAGSISGDIIPDSAKSEVNGKVVTVTFKFSNFGNGSYFSSGKLNFKVTKQYSTICTCTINNFKVSWPNYGEPTINPIAKKTTVTTTTVNVPLKTVNDIGNNKVGIMASIESCNPNTITLSSSTITKTSDKILDAKFVFENTSAGTNEVEINILSYVYR